MVQHKICCSMTNLLCNSIDYATKFEEDRKSQTCLVQFKQQIIRWPKRVNHKSVYQNTKQFPKTQINFPKHKLVSQNTNRFLKTQINFSKHKSISQNTNQFAKTQTNFSKHKPINFISFRNKCVVAQWWVMR